ncbi:MAG: hypothetical protein ABIT38_17045 [Gemmatimonadaceae bacterium]
MSDNTFGTGGDLPCRPMPRPFSGRPSTAGPLRPVENRRAPLLPFSAPYTLTTPRQETPISQGALQSEAARPTDEQAIVSIDVVDASAVPESVLDIANLIEQSNAAQGSESSVQSVTDLTTVVETNAMTRPAIDTPTPLSWLLETPITSYSPPEPKADESVESDKWSMLLPSTDEKSVDEIVADETRRSFDAPLLAEATTFCADDVADTHEDVDSVNVEPYHQPDLEASHEMPPVADVPSAVAADIWNSAERVIAVSRTYAVPKLDVQIARSDEALREGESDVVTANDAEFREDSFAVADETASVSFADAREEFPVESALRKTISPRLSINDRVAQTLEAIAHRVRLGEIVVAADVGASPEALLASVLASLLTTGS